MNPLTWGRSAAALLKANLDVLLLGLVLVVAQPLVPNDHPLARADLAPWATLVVALAALLRGGALGPGPHPMLTARRSSSAELARRLQLAVAPAALLFWYDFGATAAAGPMWIALLLSGVFFVLLHFGRPAGETAWDPPGVSSVRIWGLGSVAALALAAGLGRAATVSPAFIPGGTWLAGLLSLHFLGIGLAAGRTVQLRQRFAAGRRDGGWVWPVSFLMVLAATGPGLGFFVLTALYELSAGHPLDFGEAYVVTVFACSWASILWREPTPVAVGVLLHEVVPAGGGDEQSGASAVGFDRPPEGALRFSPLHLRRTRAVHPWIVPVRRARIGDLDDPVQPLWNPPLAFPATHVLGEASFEPDPATGAPQWTLLTIRLGGAADTMSVTEEDAQARRVVVLRPFPRLGGRRRTRATYAWDATVPAESVQVLDATTEVCQLIDGDVIVMSAEGVARAYEVELGAPIVNDAELASYRPPQIEDYVKVRS